MTRSIEEIRKDWEDPLFQSAYQGGDIADVLTLLAAVDALKERARLAAQGWNACLKQLEVTELQVGDLRRELELARHVYCARTCEDDPSKVHEATCAGMTAALQRTNDLRLSAKDVKGR